MLVKTDHPLLVLIRSMRTRPVSPSREEPKDRSSTGSDEEGFSPIVRRPAGPG